MPAQVVQAKGVPAALAARVTHLQLLLKNLPSSLPLDPPDSESTYHFYLDEEDVREEGLYFAFNRRLEICFESHLLGPNQQIVFKERSKHLPYLVQLFKKVIKELPDQREFIQERWLERLITSAKVSGAKIPNKWVIESSDSDEQPALTLEHQSTKRSKTMIPSKTAPTRTRAARRAPVTIDLCSGSERDAGGGSPNESPSTFSSPSNDDMSDVDSPHANPRSDQQLVVAPPQKPLRQQTLFAVGIQHVTKEEAATQLQNWNDGLRETAAESAAKRERKRVQQDEQKRELNRQRQQRFRERRRAEKGRGKRVKALILGSSTDLKECEDLPELSRSGGVKQKLARNGKRNRVVQRRHERVNWFHPFLWASINCIAPRVGWSSAIIARTLQREQPELFSRLHKGTIHKWISRHGRRWSKKTLKNVARRGALAGLGRVGVLTPYPELVKEIKMMLKGLRTSGIRVTCLIGHSIILAIVEQKQPELLKTFKCSEHYVGHFFKSVLNWSVRHGTHAAAHIPDNAGSLCIRTLFRIIHLMYFYDILPHLLINMDQTGIILLLSNNTTYHEKGSKQVEVVGRDEKRAYTLCVATTASGEVLPFQQVWSGKTKTSTPSPQSPGFQEAIELGMQFTMANSPKKTSHFSTLKTMKEWMTAILLLYVKSVIKSQDLPEDQKSILLIDCYPVHIGEEFCTYVHKEFPNIFLLFVPANCTGIFQPADVGIQRILKHFLRQEALNYLVDSHKKQLADGLTPEQVKFTTSLPVLHDASVQPLVNLYKFLQSYAGSQVIRKAWEKCTAGEWNLSEKCLMDRRTKAAYQDYYHADKTFRKEIEDKIGAIPGIDDVEEIPADNEDDTFDDTDVPLSCIIAKTVGIEVVDARTNHFCVEPDSVMEEEDGRLRANSLVENVWAYREDGETWADAMANSDLAQVN